MLRPWRRVGAADAIAGFLLLTCIACASNGQRPQPSGPKPAAPAASPESVPPPALAAEAHGVEPIAAAQLEKPAEEPPAIPQIPPAARQVKVHAIGPCRDSASDAEPLIDEARRKLYETLCGAALWFDGLFGERNNIATARRTSGRFEISGLSSEYEGAKYRTRGNIRFDFPNLDNRFNAFLGRDDRDEFIRDRNEGLALRSQFLRLETNERWLAGLGYSLPGTYKQRTDFRIGGKLGQEPEIFVQGRHRRNWVINEHNLWHFRETLFWTNRDGFGSTTSFDFDHVVNRTLLLRWGTAGTVSEATEGLDWRSAWLLYQNLPRARAIAYEVFIRGETANEVPLKEWGTRVIYRQQLLHRDWLAGEIVTGYSWPRFEREDERKGSYTIGVGVEILVGQWK